MEWFMENVVVPVGEFSLTYIFQPIGWASEQVAMFLGII